MNKNRFNRRRFLTGSSTLLGASMLSTLPTIANSALGANQKNAVINSDKPDHKVPILTGKEFDLYVSKNPSLLMASQARRRSLMTHYQRQR